MVEVTVRGVCGSEIPRADGLLLLLLLDEREGEGDGVRAVGTQLVDVEVTLGVVGRLFCRICGVPELDVLKARP